MGSRRRPQPKYMASKLAQIRKSLDLSQEQMAERLSTTRSPVYPTHISEFERGKREPSLLALLEYARMAVTSTDVLIDDDLDLPGNLPAVAKTKRASRKAGRKDLKAKH